MIADHRTARDDELAAEKLLHLEAEETVMCQCTAHDLASKQRTTRTLRMLVLILSTVTVALGLVLLFALPQLKKCKQSQLYCKSLACCTRARAHIQQHQQR
jgi:hypothetical protein